jgi:hypothetical protein
MTYRTRIKYMAEHKAEIWDRWQRGESLKSIGRAFDRPSVEHPFGTLKAWMGATHFRTKTLDRVSTEMSCIYSRTTLSG